VSALQAAALVLTCFVTVSAECPPTLGDLASSHMHAETRHSACAKNISIPKFSPCIEREILAGKVPKVVGHDLAVPVLLKLHYRAWLDDHPRAGRFAYGEFSGRFARENFWRVKPNPKVVSGRLAIILVLHAQSDNIRILHTGIREKSFQPNIGAQLAFSRFVGAADKANSGACQDQRRENEQPIEDGFLPLAEKINDRRRASDDGGAEGGAIILGAMILGLVVGGWLAFGGKR
jgi:hypothetical protein